MSPLDESLNGASDKHPDSPEGDRRLSSLEAQVAALRSDLADLRRTLGAAHAASPAPKPEPEVPAAGAARGSPHLSAELASALRQPPGREAGPAPRPSLGDRLNSGAALSGDELESLVGRYATVALAALVILMAVGALIKMAVERGLLTPEVRVIAGALTAAALAGAGLYFRRRGEMRYGGMLLALSLAVIDLVAWGAGPRFHLVPTTVALGIVDVVALSLAALALRDESEFLFTVAVAGALSAPFVTSDRGGTALALLLYGGTVLAGALRAVRDPEWKGAFAVLVGGAFVYALAAAALPASGAWYGPYLVAMFGGACAAAALAFGEPEWRGQLPRAYLAVAMIGVMAGWDALPSRPFSTTMGVGLALGAVTYAALAVRGVPTTAWVASALVLPLVSLGLPYAGAVNGLREGAVLGLWVVFALAAWRSEESRGEATRSGAHLLAGAILGCLAIVAWLWSQPLPFVAALAGWGVVVALLGRDSRSPLPLVGVGLALGAAVLSSIDQLASRGAYSYVPFATRSSASALATAAGIGLAGLVLARGSGRAGELAGRPVRLGFLIGFLIAWGRMEVAHAYNRDLAAFLLTSYYAACGVGSIVAGRQLSIGKLRVAGLVLAIYAALKAIVEATDIGSASLRVGVYAAVGVFLLGAGYLYRERGGGEPDAAAMG